MNEHQLPTSCIKHLAVSELSSVSARIRSSDNLTGNCFEMPYVPYCQPLCGILKNMQYRFLIVFLTIIISRETFSQIDSNRIARNVIFIEAAGVGGYGSINYERVMYCENYLMFTIRCGISTYHIVDYTNKLNPDIIIPFTLNGFYGQDHKIELGVGETYSNIVHTDLTNFKPKRVSNFNTIFSIGYCYQKNKGGILFRCAYTPIIEFNKYLRHWAGISFGYSF